MKQVLSTCYTGYTILYYSTVYYNVDKRIFVRMSKVLSVVVSYLYMYVCRPKCKVEECTDYWRGVIMEK